MDVLNSYYETLYRRPVVRLSGYAAKYNLPSTLYGYLAYGGATGSDIARLAEAVQASVREKFNINIQPEVIFV